jgi:hypothetical protein
MQVDNLISRLEAGDKDAILEAVSLIKLADEIVYNFLPIMEAARPLVLNLERLKDWARATK